MGLVTISSFDCLEENKELEMTDRLNRPRKRRFLYLLISLVIQFMVYPYLQGGLIQRSILFFVLSSIVLLGMYAVSGSKRLFWVAIVLGAPAILSRFVVLFSGDDLLEMATLVSSILFYLFMTATILFYVFRPNDVTADTICGAISVYLLIGITWSLVYFFVELVHPGSFYISKEYDIDGQLTSSDFLYFSYTTLTTLGYGDIIPVTPVARSLATLEAIFGPLYLAILIARLVGMHTAVKVSKKDRG